MRIVKVIFFVFALSSILGCTTAAKEEKRTKLASEVTNLKQQNRQYEAELKKSRSEVEQLQHQIAVLSGIKPGLSAENLCNIKSIVVTRYTGFYEAESKKKRLIVYVQPIDSENDPVKAPGSVEIELWDLKKTADSMLGQWRFEPEELKKMWVTTLFSDNYRIPVEVGTILAGFQGSLTVRVTFTDYISGKVFTEQKVVKIL